MITTTAAIMNSALSSSATTATTMTTTTTTTTTSTTTIASTPPGFIQKLTEDMVKLAETLTISSEGTQLRENLVARVQGILNTEWPKEAKVEPFGSFASGLGTDSSDLDLIILPALHDHDQELLAPGRYQDLFVLKTLFLRYSMKDVEVIPGTRIVFLRFTDHKTSIRVEVNYGHYAGLYNTRLIESYLRIDDRVRTFLTIIKAFVRARGINSSTLGSLSSYCYTLMAISYLQSLADPILPTLQDPHLVPHNVPHPGPYGSMRYVNVAFTSPRARMFVSLNNLSLGELFIGFLEYYGKRFDYSRSCVSIRCGGVISRENTPLNLSGDFFVVEDPFLLDFNVAGEVSGFMIGIIRHEFQAALQALRGDRGLSTILTARIPYNGSELALKQKSMTS